jgi:hypothetical protein
MQPTKTKTISNSAESKPTLSDESSKSSPQTGTLDRKEEIVRFSTLIEEIAEVKKCSHLEAVMLYCEMSGLEVDLAAKLVSASLKARLKIEAEDLNLIQKSNVKRIPI